MRRSATAPRAAFHHAKWHDWYVCRGCGCVVEDWERHSPCPRAELDELRGLLDEDGAEGLDLADAASQARAEGAAEITEASMWRRYWGGGLGEIGRMLRGDWAWLRGLVARPHPPEPAPADAARTAAWERMGALIERTTGRGEAAG